MKTFFLLMLIFILGNSPKAFAFNWGKCKRGGLDTRGGIGTMVGASLLNMTTSSAQFLTSTGECAMLGVMENDKKVFIADNLDRMKDEFAKGSGEYSSSFARMHGCLQSGQTHFLKIMKKNYQSFREIETKSDFDKLYQYLEAPFQNDPFLLSSCKIPT